MSVGLSSSALVRADSTRRRRLTPLRRRRPSPRRDPRFTPNPSGHRSAVGWAIRRWTGLLAGTRVPVARRRPASPRGKGNAGHGPDRCHAEIPVHFVPDADAGQDRLRGSSNGVLPGRPLLGDRLGQLRAPLTGGAGAGDEGPTVEDHPAAHVGSAEGARPLGSYEPGDGVLDPDRHGHRRQGSTVAVLTERGWPGSLVLGSHHVQGRLPLRPTSWAQPGCRCDVCAELCTGT